MNAAAWIRDARWLRDDFSLAAACITRGLALLYLIAFASWGVQVDSLVGSEGLVPAGSFLEAVQNHFASRDGTAFLRVPTVFHLGISDSLLRGTCVLGVILALAVGCGLAQGPGLVLLWVLYLSHASCGSVFMNFQWDALLLEAGLIAPLLASWRWWNGWKQPRLPVRRWSVFLIQLLLFKLMFLSGLVKLTSGDETWLTGTALTYHYETQPLPHAVAWYAHHLPGWVHQLSAWILFAIELVLPFLIFLGRIPRLLAFGGFTLLMILIMGTGNFTYFNLLTLVLCLSLLDDRTLARMGIAGFEPAAASPGQGWLLAGLGFPVAILSVLAMIPGATAVKTALAPFRCFNSYGLFRVMTTTRPEIIIEASQDGEIWKPYDHRWKPDDRGEIPRLVAPHQPRLDWQLWFAALEGQYRRSSRSVWFERLMVALLENRPEATRLFHATPFEEAPRYVRARLYRYRFTSPAERSETGHWWKREELGLYFPVIGRRERTSSARPLPEFARRFPSFLAMEPGKLPSKALRNGS